MFDKLKSIEKRFLELEGLLSNPDVIKDRNAYQAYSREHAELSPSCPLFANIPQSGRSLRTVGSCLKTTILK